MEMNVATALFSRKITLPETNIYRHEQSHHFGWVFTFGKMGIYEEGYVGFREGIVLLGFRKFTPNTLKPNKNKSESTGFTSLTCIKSLGFPFDGFISLMIEIQHTHTIHVYVATFGKLHGKYRQTHHTYPYMNCLGYKNWPPRSIPPRPLFFRPWFSTNGDVHVVQKNLRNHPFPLFSTPKKAKKTVDRWSSQVFLYRTAEMHQNS